ncbi:MAG: hypothetical protein JSS49_04445 [Planctomycetes bacterium]|nr:hypothetical protein [Planctomycetota bacterium]
MRFPGSLALLLALACGPAFAQVQLDLKYPAGSTSKVETTAKTHQILTLAGMDIETKSNTFTTTIRKVGQPDENGLVSIEEKIDVLQTEVDLPGGNKLQFDSANPDTKADNPLLEPIMERLRVSFKTPVTVVVDSMNKIKEVKFPPGLADSVDASNKSLFDADKRKKAAEQGRGFLPTGAVKPGDSWEQSVDADIGSGQTLAFLLKYTYEGTVEQDGQQFDKITGKALTVNYSVDPANPAFQSPKSDLKITESNETILFDRQLGAVQQRTKKMRIEGTLTLVINGMELPGKLDLNTEENTKRQK